MILNAFRFFCCDAGLMCGFSCQVTLAETGKMAAQGAGGFGVIRQI
jgi:hypothetical protein